MFPKSKETMPMSFYKDLPEINLCILSFYLYLNEHGEFCIYNKIGNLETVVPSAFHTSNRFSPRFNEILHSIITPYRCS